jgi:ABC-2 type transport system permease protein
MLKSLQKQNTLDLIWQLFRTDFKLKYNDSILGFLWVLMKPFSTFLIMYFVISRVFPSNDPNFALYLLIGNVFMTFWSDGTGMGLDSLLSRAGLITKVNFPRYVVLLSSTAISVVNFIINTAVVTVFLLYQQLIPNPIQIAWYFFCSLALYLVILVFSMFTSIIYVRFRDLKQLLELFNQLLFWSTPVIYSVDIVSQKSEVLYFVLHWLNPISVFLTSARNGILRNDIIWQENVFVWVVILAVLGTVAYIFYTKQIKKVAEYF